MYGRRNNLAKYEFIAPCHFGLEAVLKKEILRLGYEIIKVEDGKITFTGDSDAICRANIFLRTTERILLKIGSFHATTFDELFEGTKKLPWENYIPQNGRFWITKATSIKSKLFSPSDIQSIIAASIGKVPLPQKGSTKIRFLFHGVKRINAAASVSVIGAFTVA